MTASELIDFNFVTNLAQINEVNYSSATSNGMRLLILKLANNGWPATRPVLPCVRIWSDS